VDSISNIDQNISENTRSVAFDQARAHDIQLRQKSTELEALFITQLFKAMEKTIPDAGLYGSKRNNLPSMMFSSVMGEAVAKQGGLGLSEMIYNSLKDKDLDNIDEQIKNDSFINSYNILSTMESFHDE